MTTLNFHPRVPVFDANVRVGDRHDEPSPCPDRAALLAEMDRHGVARALIYHAQSEEISALDGNRFLESWLGNDGRLVPQWSAIPTPESLAQIQRLYAQGRVSSVRLFETWPDGAPFRPWVFGNLLNWLQAQRIPVWIPLPKIDPDDLVSTLQQFPGLVTVLVGAHYVHHLLVRPLLKTLPTAHLELSRYEPIGGVEALCREFGAERLIYGSWYWRYAMGPMLYYLHQTHLSEAELALVCAGNLERILGQVSA
jgi:hypothetical protein